jgi:hypothetical protein
LKTWCAAISNNSGPWLKRPKWLELTMTNQQQIVQIQRG